MKASLLATGPALAVLFAVAGLVFGAAYFAALRLTVDDFVSGRYRPVSAILTLTRFAGAIVLFGFAVQFGVLPLFAAFLGFLGARMLALGAARRTT